MDANDFFVWYGLDAKRVRLAKVRLLGKGQLLKFFLCGDVCDVNAVELFGIKRRAVFKGLELLGNKLKLRGLHLHGFVLALTGGECGDGGNGHINGAVIECDKLGAHAGVHGCAKFLDGEPQVAYGDGACQQRDVERFGRADLLNECGVVDQQAIGDSLPQVL